MTQTISATLPASTVYVSGTVNDVAVTWTNVSGEIWEAVADRSEDDIYHVEMTIISASGQSTNTSFTLYYGLLNLITDRTQADVDYVARLSAKGWSGMTDSEKSEWTLGLKGAYNYTDLNRVGAAMVYLRDRLNDNGYGLDISPKTDWREVDAPTESGMALYLACLGTLRGALSIPYGTPETPTTMKGLTYTTANNIEKILETVDQMLTLAINAVWYSGEIYSGEVM